MTYNKVGSQYERKYGKSLKQLSADLKVCAATISKWEKSGFDIFYKAANIIRGNMTLMRVWGNIKSRCGNPNDCRYENYGGRGIKVKMDKKDLIFLWNRDKASLMKQPSIDRIDHNGDYELNNCRFIEMNENRLRRFNFSKERKSCPKCKSYQCYFVLSLNSFRCRICKNLFPMEKKS